MCFDQIYNKNKKHQNIFKNIKTFFSPHLLLVALGGPGDEAARRGSAQLHRHLRARGLWGELGHRLLGNIAPFNETL